MINDRNAVTEADLDVALTHVTAGPGSAMPPHPELPVRRVIDSRRTAAASGPPPTRNPRRHGAGLNAQLQAVSQTRRLPVGIDPDLVFKVKAANTRLNDDALSPRGLIPLGETADYLYFVMAREQGAELAAALRRYSGGPDQDGAKGPLYTLFDRVEAIEPYGPEIAAAPGSTTLTLHISPMWWTSASGPPKAGMRPSVGPTL